MCIVGAGFTGLWTAYYLKRAAPDLRVVVLEREFAGFGASGRNGGWLSQNLYQIAAAVPDAAGRAAMTGYVTSANSAGSTVQKHVALEQFITFAKQHEHGALSSLLQTAAIPLLG